VNRALNISIKVDNFTQYLVKDKKEKYIKMAFDLIFINNL